MDHNSRYEHASLSTADSTVCVYDTTVSNDDEMKKLHLASLEIIVKIAP